jgi:putative component of toxin-antitoxin plasmid stabilization module
MVQVGLNKAFSARTLISPIFFSWHKSTIYRTIKENKFLIIHDEICYLRDRDYKDWLEKQTQKSRRQVHSRILKIKEDGHFGHRKHLDGDVWELKFSDGRRIYYAVDSSIIIL